MKRTTITLSVAFLLFFLGFNLAKAQTVKIGKQIWMLQNLDVDHYRNGDLIPEVENDKDWEKLTTGAWCYCITKNGDTYGKLYNWYAVHDKRGLAPEGFHVPSDAEWTTLTNYLGGEKIAGGKLKDKGLKHWRKPNEKATNSSGFTALPSGSRNNAGSFNETSSASFWTATESSGNKAWSRYISFDWGDIIRSSKLKNGGFGVRCIQD